MLKGDLVSTPLPAVLRQLADGVASGCLHVMDGIGEEARVYVRGGQVYAAQVPGRRPQLGARLVSSGSLGPEGLAEALEAQRTELQGWRLGELLVHLGYVDQPVVEAFINEQVREQTSDLMRWPTGTWKFRVNERTREDVAPPTGVEELLAEVARRMEQWETITETVHGPDAVPVLSAAGQSDSEMAIDPEAWSLLCKVDGMRSIADLAKECGFTLFEAGQVVYSLVRSGLLDVEEVLVGAEVAPVGGSISSRLAAAFAPSAPSEADVVIPQQAEEPSLSDMANLISAALREDRSIVEAPPIADDDVDTSIDRVSAALSALLGPTTDESLFAAPKPRTRKPQPKPPTEAELERAAKAAARAARDARRRSQDAAELATAQADLEASRAADAEAAEIARGSDHEAEIVNLAEVRRDRDEEHAEAARLAEEQAAAAAAEAEAAAAAQAEAARMAEEEAIRLAEEAEVARLAAEAEAARLAAEAEAARLAEEQAAAEAAAAAQAEADRLFEEEAARLAAEEAAQLEAERIAAEAEAARLAEEEAARLAAEDAARSEAERAAFEAEAEAARLAEEQAAADEAARLAAEAARLAEEQAAADYAAAEAAAEAERIAAEEAAEAERIAAEEAAEAERIAAEEAAAEAERIALEDAATRRRVEEELRLAAEEQAAAEAAAAARQAEADAAQAVVAAQVAADAEHAENTRVATQRANASEAFAELSATASTASTASAVLVEAAPEAEVEDEYEEAPSNGYRDADTDMASLFRELSSLGMEDAPTPAPTRPAPSPSRPPAGAGAARGAPAKKKKGLFGR